jgi:hypothetical protein
MRMLALTTPAAQSRQALWKSRQRGSSQILSHRFPGMVAQFAAAAADL